MANIIGKRKAARPSEASMKRLRIESSSPPIQEQFDDDDDDGDGSYRGQDGFSDVDDVETVDTPITPFSPGGSKWPSRAKTLKCTYAECSKTFNRPSRLATHLRSHANERPYSCDREGCDKAYIDEKHLKQHIKSAHSQERSYVCEAEGCTKSFLTGTRLRRHQKVHEGENRFRCTAYPPCNQSFRKHQTLERHIRSDHLELAPFPCTYVDPITLVACNAGFDGSGGLRRHQERVHGILLFFCPECIIPESFNLDGSPMYLGFATNAQLEAHIRKDHANCPFCDKKCSSQRELDRHVESQHSGTTLEQRKKIPCTYPGCKSSFTKKYNLDVHTRSVHEGQRYICGTFDVSKTPDLASWNVSDSCGKVLASKANMEDHIRTAHLRLPSLINANRKKPNSQPDDEVLHFEAAAKTKRGRKSKPSVLDELLGTAYENDGRRTIQCTVRDCPHKFIRDYDLQQHIQSKHHLSAPENSDMAMLPFTGIKAEAVDDLSDGNYEESREELQTIYDQADLHWEVQAHAPGGQFWVGAGAGMAEESDQWIDDEMEMRQLIDDTESRHYGL